MERFKEFIKDEFDMIYEGYEDEILELKDLKSAPDESIQKFKEEFFKSIKNETVENLINDEWFWQHLHETMNMYLADSITKFFMKEK